MGFKKEKREQIKRYILEKIDSGAKDVVKRTSEAFDISLNSVYRYLSQLEEEKIILKKGKNYELIEKEESFFLYRDKGELEEEHVIYNNHIKKYMEDLPINVRKIWEYSFDEMMNNAIDHSESPIVMVSVIQNYINTVIIIIDGGVGIFHKIKEFYNYNSLDDAVNELFKGKLTTDAKRHSGEGIFFTSRVLDLFIALSDGKVFTHDNFEDVLNNMEDIPSLHDCNGKGTTIYMCLSNYSNKSLTEVFDMYANDDGFFKTHIPVKNIFDEYPVSRSQAKRLCHRFDKFKEVDIDFKGISDIGQGFAHEIFVVYQNEHPDVRLVPTNMNEDVEKMINHVLKTRG